MKSRWSAALSLGILILAPLAGGLIKGFPDGFFSFPPVLIKSVQPEPFHLPIVILFAVLSTCAMVILIRPQWFGFHVQPIAPNPQRFRFPWWGWAGLILNILSWICSWGHFAWLGEFKDYTFAPLWLSYVLVMDGLVFRQSGSSALTRSAKTWGAMFAASAAIWWYFEFLNRFVKNWWYEGSDVFDVAHYIFFATTCFSTVLPAVLETSEWLSTHRWFQTAYAEGPRWKPWPTWLLVTVTGAGIGGLVLLAVTPEQSFPLTWLAPLAVMVGTLTLAGVETPFDRLCRGDYRQLFSLSVAALFCGFFWEMWNFWSYPKWHYAVPYVSGLRLFEMPVVGFSGYLPFGPVCWCLWVALGNLFRCHRQIP